MVVIHGTEDGAFGMQLIQITQEEECCECFFGCFRTFVRAFLVDHDVEREEEHKERCEVLVD